MRAYSIQAGPLSYTSLNGGSSNPGALDVLIDITLAASDVAASGSYVKIWGIGIDDISQSRNLFNQAFSISAGMARGLPLANPSQYGQLCQPAMITQAFGNWIGTEQTLDIYASQRGTSAPTQGGPNPVNPPTPLVLNWKKGQDISAPLQTALSQAFPNLPINMQIGKYTAPQDLVGFHHDLKNFGLVLRRTTQDIMGSGPGISFIVDARGVTVTDGSQQSSGTTLAYQDLIGQPTWIEQSKLQVKTVMRGDLHVNQPITLPNTVVATSAGAGLPNASGGFQNSLTFQGSGMISKIRHVGQFRQPSADAWCTILDVMISGN